ELASIATSREDDGRREDRNETPTEAHAFRREQAPRPRRTPRKNAELPRAAGARAPGASLLSGGEFGVEGARVGRVDVEALVDAGAVLEGGAVEDGEAGGFVDRFLVVGDHVVDRLAAEGEDRAHRLAPLDLDLFRGAAEEGLEHE